MSNESNKDWNRIVKEHKTDVIDYIGIVMLVLVLASLFYTIGYVNSH